MRIVDNKDALKEVLELIKTKATGQKVLVCIDENSDTLFIDKIIEGVDNTALIFKYYYNKHGNQQFFNLINNGIRVVIYNVLLEHFYKLQNDNPFVINVFLPQSNFVLPYMSNTESVYAENLLICNTQTKDYTTLLFLYELAFNHLWQLLVQNKKVDTEMFKNIDAISNGKIEFYSNLLFYVKYFKQNINDDYKQIEETQLPYYIYLKLCSVLKMLESIHIQNIQYLDFFKTETTVNEISKAYDLLIKYDIVDIVRVNNIGLIKINSIILNRIKIIIKKYFNFKNIKLNKLNKIIKKQSKYLNIDNLLYISYIFNCV